MRLDRYARATDFLAAAGDFLVAREAEHNLILGIASSVAEGLHRGEVPPYFAVIREGERVVAAAMQTPPYNLILSEVDDEEALAALAGDLAESPVPGVIGPPRAARAFAERRIRSRGRRWSVVQEERVYQLSEVRRPRPVPGTWRLAVPSDRPLLVQWLTDFGVEAMNETDASLVQRTLDEWAAGAPRRYWLWEDPEPVAVVGSSSRTPHGSRVGPVYTPPAQRGRGYASNLTAVVSQLLLDEGRRFCFLYTDVANPTANRIYRSIGYEPVTEAAVIRFETD
jgi:predicted GNAT family acetyltransferase